MDDTRRLLALRVAAALGVLVLVPLIVVLTTLGDEAPIRVGEPSPRTIESDRSFEIRDDEATEAERAEARRTAGVVEFTDLEAQGETLDAVRQVFSAVRLARTPAEGAQGTPSPEEQVESLGEEVDALDEEGLRELVTLSDDELTDVQGETIDLVQSLTLLRISEGEVEDVLNEQLQSQIGIRSWPESVAEEVVDPLVREVLRPTVRVDEEATAAQEQEAVDAVDPVLQLYDEGDVVVEAGEVVSPVQLRALEQLGEAGSEPGVALVRALIATALMIVVIALYLHRADRPVWDDGGRILVIASTVVLSTLALVGIEALAETFGPSWWFAYPVGGIVLLLAVLISPEVGTISVLPLAGVALLVAPALPALAIFVTGIVVLAAPMANGVTTRVALRRASVRVAVASPIIAAAVATVFGPRGELDEVVLAAALGGIAGAGILQGLLPAFETVFRLATVTALLDLADRNHPLLRELEEKALGSYNHSVMVASLTERCCREIGASHLLGQVAALYHDIGKVRQPHFFIENQRGIANPHDDLEPRVSAVIIQNHVKDGVELAERHRLPPDVVDCIGSHHGTMVVSYFYNQALKVADGDETEVDEQHYRYKGHKPRSKEAAVLLLADCCEATTRAMAMDRGTLPGDEIEQVVDRLLAQRLEDQQFADCELTFVELQKVRDTLVDALTGIYHPRIQYPGSDGGRSGGAPRGPTSGGDRRERGAAVPS